MALSTTSICNRALQKLGAKPLQALDTDDSVTARACRQAYEIVRDAELRDHYWSFAMKRAQLAAEATSPTWGRAYQYQLPSDYIMLGPEYVEENNLYRDWVIEGRYILTDDVAPLYIRYVGQVTDVTQYDPLFAEALSCKLAVELCEQLTQSNSKKATADADYKMTIARAKKRNGIEARAQVSPDAEWLSERY